MFFQVLIPALLLTPSPQELPPAARVDAVFKEYDSAASPGCAVAVFQDDKILFKRAYGMANLDHDVRLGDQQSS
jgi:CubicO group peptidase (beta-lactamase class C family)